MKPRTVARRRPLVILLLASMVALISFSYLSKSNFDQNIPKHSIPPDKIKFKAMLMLKDTVWTLAHSPHFSHFIFQWVNVSVEPRRQIYELVVYAFDSSGTQLNSDTKQLIRAVKQPSPALDRVDDVKFANYKLAIKQFDDILVGMDTANFRALKFEPKSTSTQTYPNYVTFAVYPVDKDEKDISKEKLKDVNYVKPSPPAPPGP